MKKQFAVIGVGRFGGSVARTLHKMGYEVLAIDKDEQEIEAIMNEVTHAVQLDALDIDALKKLGIRNFDVVIVGIGNDLEASILVTLELKELGVKYVVAKAANDLHGKVLERVGADKVVYPERDMGVRVAHYLVSSNVIDHIQLSSEYSIVEIQAPRKLVGLSLGEADLRANYGIAVLAIKREKEIVVSPTASDVIKEGDV
ncbi:MAG: potassium channel family protein, partial [Thermacetogeniaceae bacterium]